MRVFWYLVLAALFSGVSCAESIQNQPPMWGYQLDGRINALISTNNSFLVGDDQGVYRLGYSRNLIWSYPASSSVKAVKQVDDAVLAASEDGFVRLFDVRGHLLWERTIPGYVGFPKALDMRDDVVLVGSMDGFVYMLGKNGDYKWKRHIGSYVTEISIYGESIIAVSDRQVYILDLNGGVKRNLNIKGYIRRASIAKEKAVVALDDKKLYLYDTNGMIIWDTNLNDDITALDAGEDILVGTKGGMVYDFALNGSRNWVANVTYHVLAVESGEGYGVVSTIEGKTILFSSHGNTRWYYETEGRSTIFDSYDNNIIAGTSHGRIFYSKLPKKDPATSMVMVGAVVVIFGVAAYMVFRNW